MNPRVVRRVRRIDAVPEHMLNHIGSEEANHRNIPCLLLQ